ncbi:hypothetical protein G5I_12233 [Acromyrmex echinatior]|uniref:Uncharacterized protein n=1 Tax=Acromyrmex echinatior TaxID=103372 RepID=F4X1Q9_ACREC|nr:hypothetical protein G5I_12233 [Acromyrmex echinatior]
MGRDDPIIWPARSPDLNVLDYFIWGHIKDLVEHIRNGTETEAREATFNTITLEMAHRAILFKEKSVYESEEGTSNNSCIKIYQPTFRENDQMPPSAIRDSVRYRSRMYEPSFAESAVLPKIGRIKDHGFLQRGFFAPIPIQRTDPTDSLAIPICYKQLPAVRFRFNG